MMRYGIFSMRWVSASRGSVSDSGDSYQLYQIDREIALPRHPANTRTKWTVRDQSTEHRPNPWPERAVPPTAEPTLTVFSGKRVWRLSRLFLTLIRHAAHTQCDSPGAARDAASVQFRPSIARTDSIYLFYRNVKTTYVTYVGLATFKRPNFTTLNVTKPRTGRRKIIQKRLECFLQITMIYDEFSPDSRSSSVYLIMLSVTFGTNLYTVHMMTWTSEKQFLPVVCSKLFDLHQFSVTPIHSDENTDDIRSYCT